MGAQRAARFSPNKGHALPCRAFVDKGMGKEVCTSGYLGVDQTREPGSTFLDLIPRTPLCKLDRAREDRRRVPVRLTRIARAVITGSSDAGRLRG